ncbi:MAG TPA: DUF1318 domain-containing protein [Candidatus Hydrogenedentes bacterium]|nr:DUF1318 domain-containing protein [Candidatus Hydrogenedentota bacterium]
MKKMLGALLTVGLLVTIGCVITTKHTIDAHVTVDIRRIEEQADDVLGYIEGEREALPGLGPISGQSHLQRLWDCVAPIRPVYAAEITGSSALAKQIIDELRKRHPKLEPWRQKGVLGEDNRGYMSLRNEDRLKDPEEKNAVQRLMADENDDRKALYKELARVNKDAQVGVSDIEQIYAYGRLERAKPGEVFQLPPAGEYFDRFKNSASGKKLGDACVPGAWVEIP